MSGLARKSNSILRKLVAGVWKIVRDCCCGLTGCADCISGTACTDCGDGDTPTQYTLTVAGVVICSCVKTGASSSSAPGVDSVDGTFTLVQTGGNACVFEHNETVSFTWTDYNTDDCTGTPAATFTIDRITYRISTNGSGQFVLEIFLVSTGGSFSVQVFRNEISAADCCASLSFSNEYTSGCDASTGGTYGYDGSAEGTPC